MSIMDVPVVTVKSGKLRGNVSKNYDGGIYYSFQGIPYAKPPIGSLRFKDPLPVEPWEGIRDATKDGSDGIAHNLMNPEVGIGSEDCLFLNVFSRQFDKNDTLKPVMVWIHAGAFIVGSGNTSIHGPEFLMTKDVVVVTLNYRLGLLGFLSFDDPSLEIPGNAGLKDQVLALKWVQENIKQFKGDPNNVTLFGMSAGAASAHYLILSPLAKGLFHKCIIQSGCALCPCVQGHKTLPYLTEALEMPNASEREIFDVLKDMSAEELLKLQDKIPDNIGCFNRRCIAPVVEYNSPTALITEKPENILKSGNYNHVPIIIGFTSREGMVADYFLNESKCGYVITDFENKIPFTMNATKGTELSKTVANKIKDYYYGLHPSCEQNNNQFYLIEGDTSFVWPIIRTVKAHHCSSSEPIYLYRVSIDTSLSYNKRMIKSSTTGVAHGDDFAYIFKSSTTPPIIPNSLEETVMRRYTTMWVNFATSGKPNFPEGEPLKNIEWKPVDGDKLHFLEIGENLTVGVNPDEDRMQFWDEINDICEKN